MKAPQFWNEKGLKAFLLYPFSLIYGRIALSRFNKLARYKAHVPVLCVGNLVAGGAGKTPTALSLGKAALSLSLFPVFLTRGYGGREEGPLQVDLKQHDMKDVGDEALLLARFAPTIVAHDRVKGAKLAEEISKDKDGALIIMDDGFQNPYLYKDFNLVVVDAEQSIGNGYVMPAGPLRAPLLPQVRRADQFVLVGRGDQAPGLRRLVARLGKPSMHAYLKASKCALIGGTQVLAFSGIGRPDKFRTTLDELELDVVDHRIYADHHPYSEEDAVELLRLAREQNLAMVTTSKDHVRLKGLGNAGKKLAKKAHIVEVDMAFDDAGFPRLALEQVLRKFSRR